MTRYFLFCLLAFFSGLAHALPPSISMVPSRTTGVAPMCVWFDATGTTDDGTTRPYDELRYEWNFGDSDGGAWGKGANAGVSRNEGSGANPWHCYHTPGTYTARLKACDATSCSNTSQTITVTDPDTLPAFAGTATVCIGTAPVAGSGGCPAGAATATVTTDIGTVLNTCLGSSNKRCLIEAGATYPQTTPVSVGAVTQIQVGTYGTGSRPVINNTTATSSEAFSIAGATNFTIKNVEINGNGLSTGAMCMRFTGTTTDFGALSVLCRDGRAGVSVASGSKIVGGFFEKYDVRDYRASGGNGFFGHLRGGGFVGGTYGPVPRPSSGEHLLRCQPCQKVWIAHGDLGIPNTGKGTIVIRGEAHRTGAGVEDVDNDTYFVYVNNMLQDHSIGVSDGASGMGGGQASDNQCNWTRDVVFDGNVAIMGPNGSSTSGIGNNVGRRWTFRNNVINLTAMGSAERYGVGISVVDWSNRTCSGDVPANTADNAPPESTGHRIYNNTIVDYSAHVYQAYAINLGDPAPDNAAITDVIVRNNLGYYPNSTGPYYRMVLNRPEVIATISNNSTDDTNAGGGAGQIKLSNPFSAQPTAASIQTYRPTAASYANNGGTAVFPASTRDALGCRDRTGATRIGALVPAARAQCAGVAGAP